MSEKRSAGTSTARPRELARSGALCLAFANGGALRQDGRRGDAPPRPWVELASYGDLLAWCQRVGALPEEVRRPLAAAAEERPGDAEAALARALELRDALTSLFTAHALDEEPPRDALDLLNDFLPAAKSAYRLVFRDGAYGWDLAPLESLERPLGPIVDSAAELLTSDKLSRVRQCESRRCTRLFVSRTTRRWCDMNVCGNRGKGRRHHRSMKRMREQVWKGTPPWREPAHLPAKTPR